MEVDANGVDNVNDAIFQGEVFSGAVVGVIGPADGDLDTGDNIEVVTIAPTAAALRGVVINHAEPPAGTFTNIQALVRVKGAASTPTQGSCAFIGGAVPASP